MSGRAVTSSGRATSRCGPTVPYRGRVLVLTAIPVPDVIDTQTVPLPPGASTDAAWWVAQVFGGLGSSGAGRVVYGARDLLAPVLGFTPRADPRRVFAVERVVEGEALVVERDRHLDFALSARVHDGLLSMTTAVRLHGWRGRAYWVPVSLLHGPVTRRAMRRAAQRATG